MSSQHKITVRLPLLLAYYLALNPNLKPKPKPLPHHPSPKPKKSTHKRTYEKATVGSGGERGGVVREMGGRWKGEGVLGIVPIIPSAY